MIPRLAANVARYSSDNQGIFVRVKTEGLRACCHVNRRRRRTKTATVTMLSGMTTTASPSASVAESSPSGCTATTRTNSASPPCGERPPGPARRSRLRGVVQASHAAESINRHLDDTLWLRRAHTVGARRQLLNRRASNSVDDSKQPRSGVGAGPRTPTIASGKVGLASTTWVFSQVSRRSGASRLAPHG